ncbi:MAG: methyltransferase domain-containing protein [Ktedonobacteraceae bacterium]
MDAMNESSDRERLKRNIAGLYNRVAPLYGQVGPSFFAYAGQQLVERIGIADGAQVLDVGVGRGANLFPATQKVGPRGRVIGIDLAEQMLQETKAELERRHISNATLLQMDAEQLSFSADSFDAVLCGFAIFLFPHLEQALSEFFRVLRPGGKLGITVARDSAVLTQWYGERLTQYSNQYHFPLNAGGGNLDYAEIPAHLDRAGFVNVQVHQEEADFVYADAQQWWDAKWTHGTRYSLEHMSSEVLAQFKTEVFAKLQEALEPDGIHEPLHLQFFIGTRPAENNEVE